MFLRGLLTEVRYNGREAWCLPCLTTFSMANLRGAYRETVTHRRSC